MQAPHRTLLGFGVLVLLGLLSLAASSETSGCQMILTSRPAGGSGLSVDVSINDSIGVDMRWSMKITNSTSQTVLVDDKVSTVVDPGGESRQLAQVVEPGMSMTIAPFSFVSSDDQGLLGALVPGARVRVTLVWDRVEGQEKKTGVWVWEYRCAPVAPLVQPASAHPESSLVWQWFLLGLFVVVLASWLLR